MMFALFCFADKNMKNNVENSKFLSFKFNRT